MITNKNTQTKVDYYKIIRANEDYGVRYSGEESKINCKGWLVDFLSVRPRDGFLGCLDH
mgnify:CR=1 FL=1